MVLQFSSIVTDVQRKIISQMDFKDFPQFQESSKLALKIGNSTKARLTLPVNEMLCDKNGSLYTEKRRKRLNNQILEQKVRLEIKQLTFMVLNKINCKAVKDLLIDSNSLVNELEIKAHHNNSCEINGLLEAGQVKIFNCGQYLDRKAFSLSGFLKLENIHAESRITDELLFPLKAPNIGIIDAQITMRGLNQCYKEWVAGIRKINSLCIQCAVTSIPQLLDGLRHSWSREEYDRSDLAYEMPFEVLQTRHSTCIAGGEGPYFSNAKYFLIHRDDSKKLLITIMDENAVLAEQRNTERDALNSLTLNDYQLAQMHDTMQGLLQQLPF